MILAISALPKACASTPERSPPAWRRFAAELLATLTEFGDRWRSDGIRVWVAVDLALPTERLINGSLTEIAAGSFPP
jgi:hypothetical protein